MSFGPFGSGHGPYQKLTREYLAGQLPVFQERVPTSPKLELKFPTNTPSNLPSPPLLPGEMIQIQQHRVVCTDVFSEPAVGAVYITNYRIIFAGNLISDPESLDALQEANFPTKKDSLGGESKTLRPLPTKSFHGPSFTSFLTSPDQKVFEHGFHQPKWIQSGLKKLGSLRRSPKRSTGLSTTTPTSPGIAEEEEHTDGSSSRSLLKQKRMAVIHSYSHDAVSLDSISVSSLSEFSESHTTTETDETADRSLSSPLPLGNSVTSGDLADGLPGEVDESRSVPIPSTEVELEATLQGSYHTIDSGIIIVESVDSLPSENHGHVDKRVAESQAPRNGHKKLSHNGTELASTPEGDLDFERSLDSTLTDCGLDLKRREALHDQWSMSGVSPVAPLSGCSLGDSEVEDREVHSSHQVTLEPQVAILEGDAEPTSSLEVKEEEIDDSGDVKSSQSDEDGVATSYSKVAILDETQNSGEARTDSQCANTIATVNGAFSAVGSQTIDPDTVVGSEQSSSVELNTSTVTPPHTTPSSTQGEVNNSTSTEADPPAHSYANVCIPGSANGGVPGPQPPDRPRSSTSPRNEKKPKPLPRNRSLDTQASMEDSFASSLPADFCPVPVPRKTNVSTDGRRKEALVTSLPAKFEEEEEESGQKRQTSHSAPPLPPPRSKRNKSRTLPPIKHPNCSTKDPESSSSPLSPPDALSLSSSSSNATNTTHHSQDSNVGDTPPSQDGDSPSYETASNLENNVINSSGSPTDPTSEPIKPTPRQRSSTHAPASSNPQSPTSSSSSTSSSFSSFPNPLICRQGSTSTYDGSFSMIAQFSRTNSSSSSNQRPFSIQSPFDIVSPFAFGEDKSSPPRSGMFTWSHRLQKPRQKSPIPASTRYSLTASFPLGMVHSVKKVQSKLLRDLGIKLPEGLLLLCRNFHSMQLHIHPHNTYDTDALKELMERHFLAEKPVHQLFAFIYRSAIRLSNPTFLNNRSLPNFFHLSEELERLGLLNSKLWSVTKLLKDHPDLCPSYPPQLIVPICTPELDLIRGAKLYREGRFPTVCWVCRRNGAALLRAAVINAERRQTNSALHTDKALLHAICGCNQNAKGEAKLYIFTGKNEVAFSTPDSTHMSLTEEQVKTYYYHNCKFVTAANPPPFKSVRHSFSKLQAMLESRMPDEDYLIALDTTQWLPRVSELLSTSSSICHTMMKEAAHVLVSYESGWDRTTQIVSLAQVLLDPYYRTIDGFQVLIQKEWLWFGHPFCSRHMRQGKTKEDGPIFLQWVDCVWQVLQQCPSAFEFNERFLAVLVEHSYSSLFGTFLMNCEKERNQCFSDEKFTHMSPSTHTVSFWTWVSMVNAAGKTFCNELYDPHTHPGVIYPRTAVPCLKLWTSYYCKFKSQENVTQASTLQRQLQELVRLYQKLSAHSHESPSPPVVTNTISTSLQPVMGDKNQERARHGNHSFTMSHPGSKQKPSPPPKPTRSKSRQYESIEQYLVDKGCDPSVCKHIELSPTVCQGYLVKLGAVRKSWRRRWFVLDFNCQYLAYFQDQQAYIQRETPKGVIHLKDIVQVYQSTKRREHLIKHVFTLETRNRTFLIQAPSIITMELWVACLKLPLSTLMLEPHS